MIEPHNIAEQSRTELSRDFKPDLVTRPKLMTRPKLTAKQRKRLYQTSLDRFFPGVTFQASSGFGGLQTALDGALAVSLCAAQGPGKVMFGPRLKHLPTIAQAEIGYLILCFVDTEQEKFFALPYRVVGDNAYVGGYPLTSKSSGGHFMIALSFRDGGWQLNVGNHVEISITQHTAPVGGILVQTHLRMPAADLAAKALPATLAELAFMRDYGALISAGDPHVEIVCMLRAKALARHAA